MVAYFPILHIWWTWFQLLIQITIPYCIANAIWCFYFIIQHNICCWFQYIWEGVYTKHNFIDWRSNLQSSEMKVMNESWLAFNNEFRLDQTSLFCFIKYHKCFLMRTAYNKVNEIGYIVKLWLMKMCPVPNWAPWHNFYQQQGDQNLFSVKNILWQYWPILLN